MILDRKNNFDFFRLLFSTLVIFSHSYPLTKNDEILAVLTKNQMDFGIVAVDVFFIISGYLIFNSLKYSKTVVNYIWKRIIRIFPALFVMLLLSLCVIMIVSTSKEIYFQHDFHTYLPNNLSLYNVQFVVNNVFENNPYPKAINGSLWTLKYEFSMYIFVLLFFPLKNKLKISLVILSISWLILYLGNYIQLPILERWFSLIDLDPVVVYRLAPFFIAGSILSLLNLNSINSNYIKAGLFFLLICALTFNVYAYIVEIVMPVLVILVGISYNKQAYFITDKLGDVSYGIYIYGFIVQQTLMNYFNLNTFELITYSLMITFIISYFSWHYIEKVCLKYKNQF
jgi:peptidoglycan/LPS O-acetylase OafA/YrhL